MIKNKIIRIILTVLMLAGILGESFVVHSQNDDTVNSGAVLYYGKSDVKITPDPTNSDKGNVFFVNGRATNRGRFTKDGNNPFIEIPWKHVYDFDGTNYKLKSKFSISFDIYQISQGFRYGFYTGNKGHMLGGDAQMNGFYLIPDTGGSGVLEARNKSFDNIFTTNGKHESLAMSWNNITIYKTGKTFGVKLGDKEWLVVKDNDYEYNSSETPTVRIGYTPYVSDPGANMYVDNILVYNDGKKTFEDTADFSNNSIIPEPTMINENVEDIVINKNLSSGNETRKLIEASSNNQKRCMEYLDRGLTAVMDNGVGFISWRWVGWESLETRYNIYKNGEMLNKEPLNQTNFVDLAASLGDVYTIASVVNSVETEHCKPVAISPNAWFDIPVNCPDGGTVTFRDGKVESYTYNLNDASVADLDGDGEYEVIVKWDPSNSRDSSHHGPTGRVMIDAYKLDGTRMWRVDLGRNIRAGAHDTQFLVYDFDGNGKSELAVRTADGTIAGDGKIIGDPNVDWRNPDGRNLTGPYYLTVFKGIDGSVINTVDFIPQTSGVYDELDIKWDIDSWGDNWGNRSERHTATIAYLDGFNPSFVFCRGIYYRSSLAAFRLVNDKIVNDWVFDTIKMTDKESEFLKGQGNHAISVADVDFDGFDEIIYGAMTIDNNGKLLYSTGLGHGDAQHTGDLAPSRPGLETFSVFEGGPNIIEMRDARTGESLWSVPRDVVDVGRGASDDIDPRFAGSESWASDYLIKADGTLITDKFSIPANFLAWWDADLGREIQDSVYIYKFNPFTSAVEEILEAKGCRSNNGSKATPNLTADIFGDWREEVIYALEDNSALRVFTTTIPTMYRIPTLMHDPNYRMAIAWQNNAYNQPPHTGFNLGYDTKSIPVPKIYAIKDGEKLTNPDLISWPIDRLYKGNSAEMAVGQSVALVNGKPVRIDEADLSITPYLTDTEDTRTMVPYRFFAEALGANVDWNVKDKSVTVKTAQSEIIMKIDSKKYVVNGEQRIMDTAPVIKNDRTCIPLRMVAEALNFNVCWNNNKTIVIGDLASQLSDSEADDLLNKITNAPVPADSISATRQKGDKIHSSQGIVKKMVATDEGAVNAIDLDFDTYWLAKGGDVIQIELPEFGAVSGVVLAFEDGDEKVYNFDVYPAGLIDDSQAVNDFSRWGKPEKTTSNSGTTTEPELHILGIPRYCQGVRIVFHEGQEDIKVTEIGVIYVR